jgi:hypothetical protein
MENKEKVHLYWIAGLMIITAIICMTLININHHPWTIRFEMDNNTLEAMKSINWSAIKR